jgi:hypothetical protein
MKKGTLLLLLLVVVLGIAVYWFKSKPWRSSAHTAEAFAVKDTSAVTRIFMANKNGGKVLLERQPSNVWMVNGKVAADHTKINLLLTTLHDLQVKMPVTESMHNTAMAILGSSGIKCEVYAGADLVKTIYIGSETPDKEGTFMILEGEDQPYIIQQPGFIGFLTPRFHTSEVKWQSKLIFNTPAYDIKKLQVSYPQMPNESYMIEASMVQTNLDTQAVKVLLNSFEGLYAEGFYEEAVFTKKERDSLYQRTPYCMIEITTIANKIHKVVFYEKPVGDRTKDRYDENLQERTIDPEKFFAKIEGTNLVASVQEYAFRRVLRKKSDLVKR